MELKTYKTERYTAADEEPNCGRCDHVCDDFDCSGKCGAENWWAGYIRTESIVDETNEKGYTIIYVPYDDMAGKPRVWRRCDTTEEKNACLAEINSEKSGWLQEELATVSVIPDKNYMLPV